MATGLSSIEVILHLCIMGESKATSQKPVAVIGSGSFGAAIAHLLSKNVDVLMYTRNKEKVKLINETHRLQGFLVSKRIIATDDKEEVTSSCDVIFPVIPSTNFASMVRDFSAYFKPYRICIHGTKGFDLVGLTEKELLKASIQRSHIRTMSEVLVQESSLVRVGCLSGPNLSREIMEGQPAATVIASKYEEVIKLGKAVLDSPSFAVFGSHELIGAELAGALKNIIALASGILTGLGLGKNIQAMLITRGLREMIYIGNAMGATTRAFLGTAGIGDLIATATSPNSRNFAYGIRIAQGETPDEINASLPELAEGVRTLKIVQQLAKHYKTPIPIIYMIYKVVHENFDVRKAIPYLLRYPYDQDVDFI